MYSISRLAKEFQLSRSTLLYYDSIGLLRASKRTASQYRVYSQKDYLRLKKICMFRKTGLSLKEIAKLMKSGSGNSFASILEVRLNQINTNIQELRNQQFVITQLLKNRRLRAMGKNMSKEKWIQMFREAGLSDSQMQDWHRIFEKNSPEEHQEFLEFLNVPADEIKKIRKHFSV